MDRANSKCQQRVTENGLFHLARNPARLTQGEVYITCMAPRNHADCVSHYCDAVLGGEIIAGRYVQLAVERHI